MTTNTLNSAQRRTNGYRGPARLEARFVIYESGTGSHLGSLEFHYHELLSHDAVSAALEVADQKHEAQDEPIKMVETDLTYDKMQKMSASEATAAQLRDPKRLAISICARAPPRKQATRADLERTEDVDRTCDRR